MTLPSFLPGEASSSRMARLWYMRNDSTIIYREAFRTCDPIPWYRGPPISGEYTVHLEWTQGAGRQDGRKD
jgi:hypothetical protein